MAMINNKSHLRAFLIGFYLLFPVIVSLQFYLNLSAGRYPVDADSIALPIAGAVFVWLLGFIPFGFVVWAVSKTDLQELTLFDFNRQRFVLSVLISILTIGGVFLGVVNIYNSFYDAEPLIAIYLLVGIYLLLCLRVVFVFVGRKYEARLKDEFGLSV